MPLDNLELNQPLNWEPDQPLNGETTQTIDGVKYSLDSLLSVESIKNEFLFKLSNRDYETCKQMKETNPSIDFSLKIKERFLVFLKIGDIFSAIQIKDNLGGGIDFSQVIKDGEKNIKEKFSEYLKNQLIDLSQEIKNAFSVKINFSEEIRQGFLESLKNGRINDAKKIKDDLGRGIDFLQEIKEGFLESLKNGGINDAKKIKDDLGRGIDFSQEIKEGEKNIKQGFLECLKNGNINNAIEIKNGLGNGIDFSLEIRQGFLECLRKIHINDAIKIRNVLGNGIDFSQEIKEGEKSIKKGFLECVKRVRINDIIKIKDELGEGIDFSQEIRQGFLECVKRVRINDAKKIKDDLGRGIDFSEEIKQGFLECLKNGRTHDAIEIKYALGEGLDFSQEIKEGEKNIKKGFSECLKGGYIDAAIKIRNVLGNGIDFSQEIKEGEKNIKKGFSKCLRKCYINNAIEIKDTFGEGIDFSQEIKEGEKNIKERFLEYFKSGWVDEAIKIKNAFGDGIDFDLLLKTNLKTNINYFIKDTQVLSWYNSLKDIIGEESLIKIFVKNLSIFGNIHDNLLFVQHILGLEKTDKEKIVNLVLKPLLSQVDDFRQLNQYFGYFDVKTYIEKSGEVPFKRYDDFKREALMQKENIQIPNHASEEFRHALEILIKAPGVNVNFLKSLIVSYENGDSEYANDENFSTKLLHIIEGKNQIDERQIIKPFETIIPFDPLHKVVFTALGIHIFNRESLVYSKLFAENQGFKDITDQFISYNEQIKTSLKNEKESNIRNNPDKRGFYESQYNKDLLRNCIVSFGSGGVLSGVRYENFKEHIVPAEFIETIKKSLENIFNNPETRSVLLKTIQNFYEKRDKIMDNSEMVHFEELAMIGEKLFANNKNINDISLDDIIEAISGQEICLASFLVYLGFNNLTRQSQFNELKRDLERVINTPKYIKQSEELLKRGITNNKNPLLLYLDGELILEKEDIEKVKDILEKYNYTGIGRQLKVEITQKSDPRGWVAGDYTDCCMPLTSEKNKQYILREDLSYFLVSIIDSSGNEDIIAQSVLVACNDTLENGEYKTLAIDNVEIANRAIKYREIISQGYEELKKQFKDKKLIIGTTYNDDGGSITGGCQMEARKVSPLNGKMVYSDCFDGHEVYVYNDPEMNEKQNGEFEYYGLQSYNFKKSHIKYFVSDSDLKEINILLEKIGAGEPDGEGGMSFPDNYSCVIGNKENFQGYIVAADYLDDNGPNSLTFEKIGFAENIAEAQQVKILKNYFKRKNIKKNDDLDQVVFKQGVLSESLKSFIINYFKEFEIQENEGDIIIVI